jgi:hypothetical protein
VLLYCSSVLLLLYRCCCAAFAVAFAVAIAAAMYAATILLPLLTLLCHGCNHNYVITIIIFTTMLLSLLLYI